MKFSSALNLQISGIVELASGNVYFRGFADSEAGIPITKETYIIEKEGKNAKILRKFPEGITSLVHLSADNVVAVGKFGRHFLYDGNDWRDDLREIEPAESIFRSVVFESFIYSCSTGGMISRYGNGERELLAADIGDGDLDLIGITCDESGNVTVCGEDGIFVTIDQSGSLLFHDVPTNAYLLDVTSFDDSQLAVCGKNGLLFIGSDGKWKDLTMSDRGEDFTSCKRWQDSLFVSANESILKFDNGVLADEINIPSLNVIAFKNSLWSIGLKSIHRFDGEQWEEIVIEI